MHVHASLALHTCSFVCSNSFSFTIAYTSPSAPQLTVYRWFFLLNTRSLYGIWTANASPPIWLISYKSSTAIKLRTLALVLAVTYTSKKPSSLPTWSTTICTPPTPLIWIFFGAVLTFFGGAGCIMLLFAVFSNWISVSCTSCCHIALYTTCSSYSGSSTDKNRLASCSSCHEAFANPWAFSRFSACFGCSGHSLEVE